MNDFEIIAWVLRHEGDTYTDDPDDAGGPTKFGITLQTYAQFHMTTPDKVSADQIKALTRDEAEAIALDLYVMRPGFFQIADWRLRLAVVDFGYHSGVRRATEALQAAVGAQVDGIYGRETGWKVAGADTTAVRHKVIGARLRLLGNLMSTRRETAKFAKGWLGRVADVLEAA